MQYLVAASIYERDNLQMYCKYIVIELFYLFQKYNDRYISHADNINFNGISLKLNTDPVVYRKSQKSQKELSRDVYDAFQAIGVTSNMIHRRRHESLLEETLKTTGNKILGESVSYFIVGSRVEGSTTKGMQSDIDAVNCIDCVKVVLKLGAWQTGKINMLAFKDETTPPQFYKLCRLRSTPDGRQEYMRVPVDDTDVVDEQGRVLVSNTMFDKFTRVQLSEVDIKHGPSRSMDFEMDIVDAFPCNDLPEECEYLFCRSKAGHWPKQKSLEYAKHCPLFLIPQGHPHSSLNERKLQWRVSTALTERVLMFDFTEVQMLVFILLKMLRLEYIKPSFGDNFSTYHIKTAMMFSVEILPPSIWRIDNIVECATHCIDILIQWAQNNVCPHYTMGGVDLFDGKLAEPDIRILEALLTNLNTRIMLYICNLKMDMFGVQVMNQPNDFKTKQRYETEVLRGITVGIKSFQQATNERMYARVNDLDVNMALMWSTKTLSFICALKAHGSELQRDAADLLQVFACEITANMKASLCIESRQPVSQDIVDLYRFSFDCDLVSSKLKYASMLYCSGQYDKAVDMLNHCESLLGPDVAHYCGCYGRSFTYQTEAFMDKGHNTNPVNLIKTSTTSCVMFCKHELLCVPEHLRYETFRTQTKKDKMERISLHSWMDLVTTDCVSFLYYMQYLVHRKKDNPSTRLGALFRLMDYFHHGLGKALRARASGHLETAFHMFAHARGHMDTALHMLAHCWELEKRPDVAWHLYQQSINMYPTNNIAWVHLIGLSRKYFFRKA